MTAQHIDSLRLYFQLLTVPELVKLRHEAIRVGDNASKELLDEEFKRRDNSRISSSGGRTYEDRRQSNSVNKGDTTVAKYENGQNVTRIENNFKYHSPKDDQPQRYEEIRNKAKELAHVINNNTPASREQSLAFTALEEAVMHANSAIARNE